MRSTCNDAEAQGQGYGHGTESQSHQDRSVKLLALSILRGRTTSSHSWRAQLASIIGCMADHAPPAHDHDTFHRKTSSSSSSSAEKRAFENAISSQKRAQTWYRAMKSKMSQQKVQQSNKAWSAASVYVSCCCRSVVVVLSEIIRYFTSPCGPRPSLSSSSHHLNMTRGLLQGGSSFPRLSSPPLKKLVIVLCCLLQSSFLSFCHCAVVFVCGMSIRRAHHECIGPCLFMNDPSVHARTHSVPRLTYLSISCVRSASTNRQT